MNFKDNPSANLVFDENTMHCINPMGMRVLVEVIKGRDKSKGGLYIPDNVKDDMSESVVAKVVAVATAEDEDSNEDTNISGIPHGAMVLIEQSVGIKVPWNDLLRIVETIDVLAVIEEVELS